MTELTKRLDAWIPIVNIDSQWMHEAYNLIVDCRAEIERLSRPSFDGLIDEIEAIVTCAETAVDGATGDTYYIGEAYPKKDVLAILDKYRGM